MEEIIRRELIYLWYYFDLQFRQIFVYWAVGVLVGSAVSVFLKRPLQQMMGSLAVRTGSCYDNARMESFFATLKKS